MGESSLDNSNNFSIESDCFIRKYANNAIAVYGLGENARYLIENFGKLNIVCLVAADHIGEEKYGLKILSIDDAVKEAEIIIIAASFSVTSIIYSRIKDVVQKDMPILNMLGENLAELKTFEDDPYWSRNFDELRKFIDEHDVISFDVFDTLIMRDVLEPRDVFEIIAKKSGLSEFSHMRIESERKCRSMKCEPTLDNIYDFIVKDGLVASDFAKNLRKVEVLTEYKHMQSRKRMVSALEYAISVGKKVILTSDMYLNKEEISYILDELGINGYTDLIISCEYGLSKYNGTLYDVLREKAETDSILHIGDDELVDKDKAEEKGIDSYIICSSYRMLAKSSEVYLFDSIKSSDDKNYLGYYLSKMLNDPFALYCSNGKIKISAEIEIAYLLFPLTKLFFDFIVRNSQEYDCLLFPSRDGFFLYNLFMEYKRRNPNLNILDVHYIYSSRMSLSRAALKNESSFDVLMHKFFGNRSKNCKKYIKDLFDYDLPEEFDYSCGELIDRWGRDEFLDRLHGYIPDIVSGLEDISNRYFGYLESLGMSRYNKIAMVDIVSYGTQPYCLSQMLDKPVDMISIGTTGIPNVFLNTDRVRSIYGNVNEEVNGSLVSKSDMSVLHLLLEVLYSSREGQFLGVSETGEPEFLEGSEYNSSLLDGVQTELSSLFEEYGKSGDVSCDFSPEFCHALLRILRSKFSVISDQLKQKFVFSDPYDGGFVTVNLIDSL